MLMPWLNRWPLSLALAPSSSVSVPVCCDHADLDSCSFRESTHLFSLESLLPCL